MRDPVKTKGLIALTLMCCLFILFLPNFDVLPDRRYSRAPSPPTKRKVLRFECFLPADSQAVEHLETPAQEVPNAINDSFFKAPIFYVVGKNNSLRVSSYGPEANYVCKHRQIRASDLGNRFADAAWSKDFSGEVTLEGHFKHVHLRCKDNSSMLLADYFIEVLPKDKVEHLKQFKQIPPMLRISKEVSRESFSVLLILVSGMSRRGFASKMMRSAAYLKADPNTVDMQFHSQLGFSRLLNLFSLLAGQPAREPELTRSTSPQTGFPGDLIWKSFGKSGYVTVSSEDDPETGTLNFDGNQFRYTDFTPLTLVQAYKHAKLYSPNLSPRLMAQNPGENFYLDHASRLLRAFQGHPLFVYLSISNISAEHVAANGASFDDQFAAFMRKLKTQGHLKDSLMLVMSEYAEVVPGRQPHALPLYISLPKKFVMKYPELHASLKNNSASVTTHFDVHATLLELVGTGDAQDQQGQRQPDHGQSLFRRIPYHRPCETILVPKSLCPCQPRPLPKS